MEGCLKVTGSNSVLGLLTMREKLIKGSKANAVGFPLYGKSRAGDEG
jgi:hypothetical protein